VARSGLSYESGGESEQNLEQTRLLDEQYLRLPFYGIRRMTARLPTQGERSVLVANGLALDESSGVA
jgi:hypothetical protein